MTLENRVLLTPPEIALGAHLGCMRHTEAVLRGRRERYGSPTDGWGAHIEGACAELAFAKWAGVYCGFTLNSFKAADVSGWDIRLRSGDWHDLRMVPEDDDDRPFVLMLGKVPQFVVRGWIWGWEGKVSEWYKDLPNGRGAAYWVPQNRLRDMDSFRRDVMKSVSKVAGGDKEERR